MQTTRRKHVPQRTCLGCQQQRAKRDLIRIVRTPEGTIEIDPKGKRAGRGTYLCDDSRCWAVALTPGKLGHALKCRVERAQIDRLREQLEVLQPKAAGVPDGPGAAAGTTA